MAKAIATRPARTRLSITIDTLTVSVVNMLGAVEMLAATDEETYADMMDYYANADADCRNDDR